MRRQGDWITAEAPVVNTWPAVDSAGLLTVHGAVAAPPIVVGFNLGASIGYGGTSVVWAATRELDGSRIALKVGHAGDALEEQLDAAREEPDRDVLAPDGRHPFRGDADEERDGQAGEDPNDREDSEEPARPRLRRRSHSLAYITSVTAL